METPDWLKAARQRVFDARQNFIALNGACLGLDRAAQDTAAGLKNQEAQLQRLIDQRNAAERSGATSFVERISPELKAATAELDRARDVLGQMRLHLELTRANAAQADRLSNALHDVLQRIEVHLEGAEK